MTLVDRLLTVPNVISVMRLFCIPWFGFLVWGAKDLIAAAALLSLLGATDWVDGYIARRFDQVSAFGKVVDPSADRLLLVVAAVAVVTESAIPAWFAVVALGREVLVIVAGLALYLLGAARIDVQFAGKAGAFALMFSLPLFLVSVSGAPWGAEARLLAWFFGIPGVLLNWYSLTRYAVLAKQALQTGRGRRRIDRVDDDS